MSIKVLFLLFLIYSFIGWFIEVVLGYIEQKKFVNRGFLIGPYCPIHGVGAILMILLLKRYVSEPFTFFIMAILVFSILEYFTSYFMEKIFKARWWDYNDFKFNINGRICLETMIPFGILGVIIMYVVNPFLLNILNSIPATITTIVSIILLIILLIDYAVSLKIILGFKSIVKSIAKDSTEEIREAINEIILKKTYLYRRLVKAFPFFEARDKKKIKK